MLDEDRSPQIVFETERLWTRVSTVDDSDFFYELWTDPRVMGNVGFPLGLPITREQIWEQLRDQEGHIFDSRLMVFLRVKDEPIGECKLGRPNQAGISTTDVKLLPEYWGHKYGVEIKKALVDYLFNHTSCKVIEATPNVENTASIRMQEAVGGVCMGEDVFPVSEKWKGYAIPVHHYVYHVYRETWKQTQE